MGVVKISRIANILATESKEKCANANTAHESNHPTNTYQSMTPATNTAVQKREVGGILPHISNSLMSAKTKSKPTKSERKCDNSLKNSITPKEINIIGTLPTPLTGWKLVDLNQTSFQNQTVQTNFGSPPSGSPVKITQATIDPTIAN